jgi:hypothetical protein
MAPRTSSTLTRPRAIAAAAPTKAVPAGAARARRARRQRRVAPALRRALRRRDRRARLHPPSGRGPADSTAWTGSVPAGAEGSPCFGAMGVLALGPRAPVAGNPLGGLLAAGRSAPPSVSMSRWRSASSFSRTIRSSWAWNSRAARWAMPSIMVTAKPRTGPAPKKKRSAVASSVVCFLDVAEHPPQGCPELLRPKLRALDIGMIGQSLPPRSGGDESPARHLPDPARSCSASSSLRRRSSRNTSSGWPASASALRRSMAGHGGC